MLWYQGFQTLLYLLFTISVALISTTSVSEETLHFNNTSSYTHSTSVVHHGSISVHSTIIVFTALLSGFTSWFHFLKEEMPLPDSAISSFMVVVCVIFPLSYAPTVFTTELASNLFATIPNIRMWKDALGTLLVLGCWVLVGLKIYLANKLFALSNKMRACIVSIFFVCIAAPCSMLVVLAPRGDAVSCGIILILEVMGPSLFAIAYFDRAVLQKTKTLKTSCFPYVCCSSIHAWDRVARMFVYQCCHLAFALERHHQLHAWFNGRYIYFH